jgi:hypothetical protein
MFAEVAASHACVTFEVGETGRVSLIFVYLERPGYIQNSLPWSPARYVAMSHVTDSPDAFCQEPRLYVGLSTITIKCCDIPKVSKAAWPAALSTPAAVFVMPVS